MIFLPYRDDNPTNSPPVVNWVLIGLNLWVYLAMQLPLDDQGARAYYADYGFIPVDFFTALGEPSKEAVFSQLVSAMTSMFSHGGLLHLLGNLLFLYLFGDNVEDAMGKFRYLFFYLACGLLAALGQAFAQPQSMLPMIGASGAISGVLAGYLLLYPRANVRVFYWFLVLLGTIYLPAYLLLGLWFLRDLLAFTSPDWDSGGIATAAHLGGFAAGLLLTPLMKKSKVRMFQSGNSRPFSRHARKFR